MPPPLKLLALSPLVIRHMKICSDKWFKVLSPVPSMKMLSISSDNILVNLYHNSYMRRDSQDLSGHKFSSNFLLWTVILVEEAGSAILYLMFILKRKMKLFQMVTRLAVKSIKVTWEGHLENGEYSVPRPQLLHLFRSTDPICWSSVCE